MSKRVSANLHIKRKYLVWLKDARGLSEASIDKAAAAVATYESWLGSKDFRAFHSERARSFKRHLASRQNGATGARLSPASINGTLREVKAFFKWLADQPGYRSKLSHSDADYLSPDRKSEMARRSSCWKPHPSPSEVIRLLRHMSVGTVIERRDRALVAFLFLSASRETAAISLRLGDVDLHQSCVHFNGRTVATKYGKTFTTAFFPFDPMVEKIVRDWIAELRSDHGFSASDPLFPKTKVGVGADRRFAALGIAREQWASASSAAGIFKLAFADAGLPPFSPHRVRDTAVELANEHCRTPEEFKAWSQNMGHEDVLTTFRSYGSVPQGRQVELMTRFRKSGSSAEQNGDFDLFERE